MNWLILCLLSVTFCPVIADLGILSVRITSDGKLHHKEYCVACAQEAVLPKSLKNEDYHPVVDFSQSTLCVSPEDPNRLSGAVVEALRGNCTFLQKGLVAQDAGATSLLVVSATKITTPDVNQSKELKIPVALISSSDHKDIWVSGGQVSAALYNPDPPIFDYNLIIIWSMAMITVITGGYWSGLTGYKIAKTKERKERQEAGVADGERTGGDSESDTESEEEPMTITLPIIIIWVIMIMVMLLLLFFFYNYMVYVVIVFYCLGAANGLHTCLLPILKCIMPCKRRLPANKIPLLSSRPYIFSVVLGLACIGCVVCWFVFRHESFAWILLDVLGIAFCISVLKLIHIPNFKICFILLSLLFIYDIFFVFITPLFTKDGTSVMVKAATGGSGATEQIPVLLQVPRLSHSSGQVCQLFSMLGFGDILVPGLLVGYCCSFDFKTHSRIKAYYIASCVAYGIGLILTFVALVVMQTGQPALLYLVPCTVLITLAQATIRRQLSDLWHARQSRSHTRTGTEESTPGNSTEPTSNTSNCSRALDTPPNGTLTHDTPPDPQEEPPTPTPSSQMGQDQDGESDDITVETQPLLPLASMPVTEIK
ncbi:signal peptide peptidase-like 2B isoform X2 [Acanthaster planci]|uniref:Signal peptide peptidase-like 2B isoform X2 n=1 Tax=Acanthaster planci TaxID=133434 RepID=A0A8B7ZSW1_ACAPL|nr:signal peptide peptidase-like 2B isoform X2 [Acanthaster planci]